MIQRHLTDREHVFASRTMRAESYGLETYSPYQDLDLEDAAVFDGGDLGAVFWRYQ